jgi:hypothetical protein
MKAWLVFAERYPMPIFKQSLFIERLIKTLLVFTLLAFTFSFFSPSLPRFMLFIHLREELALLMLALLSGLGLLKKKKWIACMRFSRFKPQVVFFFITFILVSLTRLPYLIYYQTLLNADKSVSLLMIKNIVGGVSFPIYFYGQFYLGTLPTYLYSLLYAFISNLNLSVLFVNLAAFSLFVCVASMLIKKITNRSSFFYSLIFLSIPLTGLNLYTNDIMRGIPFIILFEILLMYLIYQAIFGDKKYFFLIGLIAGILFWLYQPSLTFALIACLWLFLSLIISKKFGLFLQSLIFVILGFFTGNLPHILAEINNHFISTKVLFLSSGALKNLRTLNITSLWKILKVALSDLDVNHIVALVFFLLFVFGFCYSLISFIKKKDIKKIYLPIFVLANLIFLILSGYPPTSRYLIHYRLYSIFTVLIPIQALQELKIFQKRKIKTLFVLLFAGLFVWKTSVRYPELQISHEKNIKDIMALENSEAGIILGNYWDTMRLSPFVKKEILMMTAPTEAHPQGIFTFSKYYPSALKLGQLWDSTNIAFLAPPSKSISTPLNDLNISFNTRKLPSQRYTLYTHFSKNLSPAFFGVLNSNLKQRYMEKNRSSYLFFKEKLSDIQEPVIQEGRITFISPWSNDPTVQGFTKQELRDWRYVLRKGSHQLSFPLDFSQKFSTFILPQSVGIDQGTYQKYIYYLNMPVFHCGKMEIPDAFTNKHLLVSNMQDTLVFTPMRDKTRKLVKGLPVERLELTILDSSVHYLECQVYSFFNFDSTIWTNRYQQVVSVNSKEFVLRPGVNRLKIDLSDERVLCFDTKYKSLLLARDSQGNIMFPNTGVVLEKMTLFTDGSSLTIVPFLKKDQGG